MRRSSAAVWTERSVSFGRYWRSNPLVFSLEPRCHGERIAEVDGHARGHRDVGVVGHLAALVPRHAATEFDGQRHDGLAHRHFDRRGRVVVRQVQQENEP